MGKFKNIEFGKHGVEGLSNGGEIWTKSNQRPHKDITYDITSKIEKTSMELLSIAKRFYLSGKDWSFDDLVQNVIKYNILIRSYARYKKEYYNDYYETDYDVENSNEYNEYKNVLKDLEQEVKNRKENQNNISR